MHFRLDQLGKNVLRDFFMLVGSAETQVEVPAGDAQRIDIWHVPDRDLFADERDFIMETREWYEQFNARRLEEAEESGRRKTMARLCGKRLGRSLTEVESAALVTRLDHLGEERVAEVILSSSSDALSTWLADPNAK